MNNYGDIIITMIPHAVLHNYFNNNKFGNIFCSKEHIFLWKLDFGKIGWNFGNK